MKTRKAPADPIVRALHRIADAMDAQLAESREMAREMRERSKLMDERFASGPIPITPRPCGCAACLAAASLPPGSVLAPLPPLTEQARYPHPIARTDRPLHSVPKPPKPPT